MPRPDGAVDIHAPTGHTGVRIQGGNFEIDKLKREIRLFGENAHTFLEIEFHHSPEPERDPSGPDPNGENQQQQFIFPFSDEKSLTYFHAQYLKANRHQIQTITTTLKEKDKARTEYNEAVQVGDSSAIITSKFRGDEYTIEMGNKPDHTKFIVVQLEYSEPLKSELRVDERIFSLNVPRHKKKRFKSLDITNQEVNIQSEGDIEEATSWIDEVEIIECLGEHSNTGGDPSAIARIEVDDSRWEPEEIDGISISEGRKWILRELLPGEQYEIRIINGVEKRMPKRAPVRGAVKNDLEFRFFMKAEYNPIITIQSIGSDPRFGREEEAIVSIDLCEKNIRNQLKNQPQPMEMHDTCSHYNVEYDSNNDPIIQDNPIMEYIFLVDCSGSMSGSYIENTKMTMELILKSLAPMSRIIICRFGTRYEFQPRQTGGTNEELDQDNYYNYRDRPRGRRPVPHMRVPDWIEIDEDDEDQEDVLMDYLKTQLKANMGGTNIQEPLLDIFNLKMDDDPNVYRNIIVMTDGAVTNTREVITMVKQETIQHEGRLRFFSLGIGSGASKSLCDGIAKNGRGAAFYVLEEDRIQTKASQILEAASRPSVFLREIILPPGIDRVGYSACPNNLNMPIFGFKRIFLRLRSNAAPVRGILMEGIYNNHQNLLFNINGKIIGLNYTICPFNSPKIENRNLSLQEGGRTRNESVSLKAFWAKQEIDFLEDERPANIYVRKEQIEASLFGGVLCDYTAFVGVKERQGRVVSRAPMSEVQGLLHSGNNTMYMAAGARPRAARRLAGGSAFSGAGGLSFPPPPAAGGMMPAGIRNDKPPMSMMMGGPPAAGGIGGARRKSSKAFETETVKSARDDRNKQNSTRLDKLMSYTRTSGLWNAKKGVEIIRCLELFNKNFGKIFEHLRFKIQNDQLVLTILALVALEKYEADKQVEWYHISKKAKTKLSSHGINADEEIKSIICDLS